mgnify:FL=1
MNIIAGFKPTTPLIEMPDNYKDLFTVAEYECIQREKRNGYPAIHKRSVYKSATYAPIVSDFTDENINDIIKISAKWCKNEGAKYFGSCDDLDIIIDVYVYNGITFKFMQYFLSDFKRRENNDGYFPKYSHELR